MLKFLDDLPLGMLAVFALTLGLAPFVPEPHVWEKLQMLFDGTLTEPMDMFDLAMHGLPWLVLMAKLLRELQRRVSA